MLRTAEGVQGGIAVAVILVALGIVVYAGSLSGEFLNWDDLMYVPENPELEKPLLEGLVSVFGSFHFSVYNPLQRLSYLVEWKLFGDRPAVFRVVNLALHLACAWLVYLLVSTWLGRRLPAIATAALFVVHPANVENVAWISERKTLLAAGFAFGATLAWLRHVRGWRPGRLLALALFTLGLMAKPSVVVLPGLFFLLDRAYRRRFSLLEYAPFAVPAVLFTVTQILAAERDAISVLHGGTPLTHVATLIGVLPRYLAGVVWPFGQAPRHLFPDVASILDPRLLLGLLCLGLGAVAVLRSAKGERRFLVALPWFVLTLLPVLVVPIPVVYADRFLYLAMPFLLAPALDFLLRRRGVALLGARVGLAAVLLVSILSSAVYARAWTTSVRLWERSVARYPEDQRAWTSLASALLSAGDAEGAASAYRQAVRIDSTCRVTRQNWAMAEAACGRPEEAERILAALTEEDPRGGVAWANLAMVRDLRGDERGAALTFRQGLLLNPGERMLWKNLGKFHLNHGRAGKGAAALERAVRVDPGDEEAWSILAEVYRRSGLPEEAARCEVGRLKASGSR